MIEMLLLYVEAWLRQAGIELVEELAGDVGMLGQYARAELDHRA